MCVNCGAYYWGVRSLLNAWKYLSQFQYDRERCREAYLNVNSAIIAEDFAWKDCRRIDNDKQWESRGRTIYKQNVLLY